MSVIQMVGTVRITFNGSHLMPKNIFTNENKLLNKQTIFQFLTKSMKCKQTYYDNRCDAYLMYDKE